MIQLSFFPLDRMDVKNDINQSTASQSNSPTSSNSELDKDLADLDLNGGSGGDSGTNGDKTGDEENGMGSAASLSSSNHNTRTNTLKMRISSSRTPTRKAKRVRFFRNGDRFYAGIVIPVSNERYRCVCENSYRKFAEWNYGILNFADRLKVWQKIWHVCLRIVSLVPYEISIPF